MFGRSDILIRSLGGRGQGRAKRKVGCDRCLGRVLRLERRGSSVSQLPPKPDFAAIEAAAHSTADRRTFIMALIGNLVYAWANNESMFIYVLMVLMNTDEASAAIVFA